MARSRLCRGSLLPFALGAAVSVLSTVACDTPADPVEICGNGVDDDGDLVTDCDDLDCAGHPSCAPDSDADIDVDVDGDVDSDSDSDADADPDPDEAEDAPADGDVDGGFACDPDRGEAFYSTTWDSAIDCAVDRVPLWMQLYWEARVPAGTSLVLSARTADRASELDAAVALPLAEVPPDASPANVASALTAAGVPNGQRYFRLDAELRCDEGTHGLTLLGLVMYFDCDCPCDVDETCTSGCACDEDC